MTRDCIWFSCCLISLSFKFKRLCRSAEKVLAARFSKTKIILSQMWLPVLVWVAVAQGSAKPLGALQGENPPPFLPLPLSFPLFLSSSLTFSPGQVSSGRPDSYRVSRELLTHSAFSTQSCRGSPQQPRARRAREEGQQRAQQQQQQAPAPQPPPQRRTSPRSTSMRKQTSEVRTTMTSSPKNCWRGVPTRSE